jgi:glutathione S-transferase
MFTLFHHVFCPHSRSVRLILGEYGLTCGWSRSGSGSGARHFWLNPRSQRLCCSPRACCHSRRWNLAEFIDEAYGAEMDAKRLMPVGAASARGAPADGLVQRKIFEEASGLLVTEPTSAS